MRRPAVRFLLTLVAAASILGVVPATTEAGIIPWAWDTMFGPVGSIQARRATYYSGGYNDGGCCDATSAGAYYGPARPMFVGFRGWRRNNACCGTPGYANYGYANYGYADAGYGGCSSCCTPCGGNCSSCGVGYDGGYIQGCGPGGCPGGQCNVNYGSATGPATGGASPVTPAAPGGPSAGYDTGAGPMTPGGTNNVVPPPAPGAETNDGFVPRGGTKSPAPGTNDPTKDEEFVPPKVNNPDGTNAGAEASSTTVPPVEPNPTIPARKKPILGEDDEKGGSVGPRLELEEKVTWHRSFVRTRQAQTSLRVTASANRSGMFPKVAWRSTADTELASK